VSATVAAPSGEAEQAFAELNRVMDRLAETISEETARARAGRLAAAAELSDVKLELARLYNSESQRAKVGLADALPGVIKELRAKHAAFQSLLQTNLTVLATAHAVSEGIIRGVCGELARKQAPSTYGASGRANVPSGKTSQPLALSRTL
jgi:hypothetical protein